MGTLDILTPTEKGLLSELTAARREIDRLKERVTDLEEENRKLAGEKLTLLEQGEYE